VSHLLNNIDLKNLSYKGFSGETSDPVQHIKKCERVPLIVLRKAQHTHKQTRWR